MVYAGSLRHNKTGLILATPEEFGRELRTLLAAPARALAMAEVARAWVAAERLLHRQVAPRLDWYRDLWAQREALDAMLLWRMPEMA